jgi:hypothetical protein
MGEVDLEKVTWKELMEHTARSPIPDFIDPSKSPLAKDLHRLLVIRKKYAFAFTVANDENRDDLYKMFRDVNDKIKKLLNLP